MISRLTFMLASMVLVAAGPALPAGGQAPAPERMTSIFTELPPRDTNDPKKDEKKEEELKPFEEVIKEMEKIEGLFTFYRKADEDKVLVELLPNQFDRDYIFSAKVEQATGERGLYGTIMSGEFVFQWRQLGKRVEFVQKNVNFRAAPGSPAARAVEKSFSDSILSSGKLASKPHPERKSLLVDLSDIFLASDLPGLGQFFKEAYKTPYQYDKDNSGFVLLKSFPKNSEVGVVMRYRAAEFGTTPSATLPDPRSLNVSFRLSLVALPENDFQPRLADDRVGHFLDMYMDFTSDKPETPYVRYINRWNLKKKDPSATVSEPVEPIVFWLENSIPEEYREWFREGILLWNQAFEKAGFKNALVVKQQPDDADWDPADIRYNTVRWFVAYDSSFAIGPSHSNPYTGQIIDADIGWSEALSRFQRRGYEERVSPVQRLAALKAEPVVYSWGFGQPNPRTLCTLGEGVVEHAGRAYEILSARPDWSSEKEREFMRQFTIYVMAHEVGHTLGLRHNFRSSTVNTMEQLSDTKRTHAVGQAASLMEYAPSIVALQGERQGDYAPVVAGSYDHWAIEYAYKPIPSARTPQDELPELRKIASRVADPLVPYGTDEDAGYNPRALDPSVNHWDASDDPLAFFAHEMKLVEELWANMEAKLLAPGLSYNVLRRSFGFTWGPYFLGSHAAMKYIGGTYHHRDHVGDPGGRLPFVPVPAAKQREALEFLAKKVWAPDTFRAPADLLNKLQYARFWDFSFSLFTAPRLDYPLHDTVLFTTSEVLNDLYHPIKLGRLLDQEMRFPNPNDRFTLADMFVGVRTAIWSELDSGSAITSFRRNLQRAHLRQLLRVMLEAQEGTPEDAISLARADLVELQGKIGRTLTSALLDYTTRAHLEETQARIRQALDAHVQRQP
jgi:hypothetical protein